MARPEQRYLDPSLFVTAPFTSLGDIQPVVFIDPLTGDAVVPSQGGAVPSGTSPITKLSNSVSQTFNKFTSTKVVFDTKDFDETNIGNLTNNNIVIGKAGFYLVNTGLKINTTSNAEGYLLQIRVNGVDVSSNAFNSSNFEVNSTLNATAVLELAVGDVIESFFYYGVATAETQRNSIAGKAFLSVNEIANVVYPPSSGGFTSSANGLVDDGTTVKQGGTFTEATTITGNNTPYKVKIKKNTFPPGSTKEGSLEVDPDNIYITLLDQNFAGSYFIGSVDDLRLGMFNGTSFNTISLPRTGRINISDPIANYGASYASNYFTTQPFDDRRIPDVGAVKTLLKRNTHIESASLSGVSGGGGSLTSFNNSGSTVPLWSNTGVASGSISPFIAPFTGKITKVRAVIGQVKMGIAPGAINNVSVVIQFLEGFYNNPGSLLGGEILLPLGAEIPNNTNLNDIVGITNQGRDVSISVDIPITEGQVYAPVFASNINATQAEQIGNSYLQITIEEI